jgi:hypothetical protein
MSLDPQEFVCRFSLHLLPRGFTKIRHYGLLSSKVKPLIFTDTKTQNTVKLDWVAFWKQKGLNIEICPGCKKPTLMLIGEIPKRGPPAISISKYILTP